MIDLMYINTSGKAMSFRGEFVNAEGTVHGRRWKPQVISFSVGARVERFEKEPYEIPMKLICRGSKRERFWAMNTLHNLFEEDIAKKRPGILRYGEWFCECFIISSEVKMNERVLTWIDQDVIIYVPSASWWKEERISIAKIEDDEAESEIVSYPTVYPFRYPIIKEKLVTLENSHYDSSDFVLTVYGPATEIDITISGNRYRVDHPLETGEILTIDTRDTKGPEEKCYLTQVNGDKVNVYNYRDKDHNLYEKIPPGNIDIRYSRLYAVDLKRFISRSEPEWQL